MVWPLLSREGVGAVAHALLLWTRLDHCGGRLWCADGVTAGGRSRGPAHAQCHDSPAVAGGQLAAASTRALQGPCPHSLLSMAVC
jgi:hypothetical protein